MVNLSVFNDAFELEVSIGDEELDSIATELGDYFAGEDVELSDIAQEIVEIEQSKFRSTFIKLMLFVNGEMIHIRESLGVSKEVVEAYKQIIWNTDKIKGQIGRVELFMHYLSENESHTDEYAFGQMLKEAYEGGQFVVLSKFHIEVDKYSNDAYKDRVVSSLIASHKQVERGEKTHEEYMKDAIAAEKFITVYDKSKKTLDTAKAGTMDSLIDAINEVKKIGRANVEIPVLDIMNEEVIDVQEYNVRNGLNDDGETIDVKVEDDEK